MSKCLTWIGTVPLIIIPLIMMLDGELWRGLGVLAFFSSMIAGVALGAAVAGLLNAHLLKGSDKLVERLRAGFSAFGFLFLPPLVGSWTNAYLNTGIEMTSLGAHFMWASIAGSIFFCISPVSSDNAD